jgi:uncharacterized protein involved in exopolysaccharide biosynthesis/Mrp family chromosome partitioning ATPase
MTSTNERRVTPRDVARILFRHKRKLALFFFGAIGLTLLVIAFYPRSYASESKLLLKVGRESVSLDPTATTGETIMLQKTQEDEVNSALNILSSREIFERVAERVGMRRIIEDRPSDSQDAGPSKSQFAQLYADAYSWLDDRMESLRLLDHGTEIDQAIRELEKNCRVTAPKQSMVITIKYLSSSPELAHDVVAAMTEVFLDEHSRLNQTEGSLEFFAEQAEKLHNQLITAQGELRDRRNAFRRTSETKRLSILENAREALRERVSELQIQESELSSRYTSDYPLLKEVRRQRSEAERLLTDMIRETAGPSAIGQTHASPVDKHNAQLASNAVLRQVDHEAAIEPSNLNSEIESLNDQEFELAQLEREVRLLEDKYAMHVEKLEQARVNEELGRERITNVTVAQPATLVHKPVRPVKALIVGIGLLVATFGALGLTFVAESCDQSLRTTDQVEAQLGLPVLASLPTRHWWSRRNPQATLKQLVRSGGSGYGNYPGLLKGLRSVAGSRNGHAKTVGIVGCDSPKLRSEVAGDLAIQAASFGTDSVLLIDADVQRGQVARRFRLNGSPGWREILAGSAPASECIRPSKPQGLAVIGPGRSKDGAPPAGLEAEARGRLDAIKAGYGLVIIDLPPARELSGPSAGEWIDEVVLVVEAERTRIQVAQRMKEMIQRAGVRIAGVVLANRREHIPGWLYQRL